MVTTAARRPSGDGGAVDLRVVPDVDRQRAAHQDRGDVRVCGGRTDPAARSGAGQDVPARGRVARDDHDDDDLGAGRPDTDAGGCRRTSGRASTRCSIPTGVTGPRGRGDDVGEPALDPERPVVVEVADVAGAVPAGVRGGRATRCAHSRS